MNEITNNNPFGTTNPTQIAFTGAFKAEYDGWRKRRPQWLALCKAIRNELPKAEIYAHAAEAGATFPEVSDLQTLFHRGRNARDEAAKLDAAEKQLVSAQKRLDAALKQLDAKGLSPNASDEARNEAEIAAIELDRAKMAVIGPRQAAQAVALARSENLI